ncbi:hypothetical protein EASAB2608_02631 [Streptomyces sp. EAS-AB2608]|nr:hypothetical protein EASAB2608_02631 [Streptomyces sp. EAS-AB2608]
MRRCTDALPGSRSSEAGPRTPVPGACPIGPPMVPTYGFRPDQPVTTQDPACPAAVIRSTIRTITPPSQKNTSSAPPARPAGATSPG